MNALTRNGETHDFTTIDELRALVPLEITHLYRDGLTLVGFDARPVMHVLGTLKEPVTLERLSKRKDVSHE